ncbi:unnamed protein product [Auanema sp. JU1783]|nr:unnamed protein product [Auanema sp. JU1783]
MRKEMKKEQKRMKKEMSRIQHAFGDEEKLEIELAQREMERERQLEIDRLKWTPTIRGGQVKETYPFVFDAKLYTGYSAGVNKTFLPEGAFQENYNTHDCVTVPAVKKTPLGIDHVFINQMDEIGQMGFRGFEKLNIIQSIVFEQAYKTKENLLICAPTGAGKTNIAMLTILNVVHQYIKPNGVIAKDDFKIVYIAPMKALATEMTASFSQRLAPLGLTVRELTGDTQLSKKELSETQMLVVTPEKWDVVTRKGTADNSLSSLVRLLIIDEVHLLQDERGPVIETIVSRTLRQVEMSQSGIRILGLSATLPNYVDVAKFLRVNPHKGLFFFDERFRPVPLSQKFIGVKKGMQRDVQENMDELCYEEVLHHVKEGNQVLVFVHARNATRRVALDIIQRAARLGKRDVFLPSTMNTAEYGKTTKSLQSRNTQLYEVVQHGFGVHHAGLLRKDRLLMEKMFAHGHLMVLVCTSTLAWGVNLPAHAVIIRGTDVFDAEKGQFSDLGVLDVQQIFGRAGRPQFQTEGYGTIITNHAKMGIYLSMLTRKDPIESQFHKRLHDNLNAEISLGTVSNVEEAVEWLTYSYYYTRINMNPVAYGLSYRDVENDPGLYDHLRKLVITVATKLDDLQMIRYDGLNSFLNATDLGRIASDFYIKHETIELLQKPEGSIKFGQFMPDDMILGVISISKEFSQIKVRDDEYTDLEELTNFACMLPVRSGGLASTAGKVNVLLQALISNYSVRSFSLASECNYISQNAGRLCRAIFEITLRRGWAQATNACLTLAKCIEKKVWRHQTCLRQLSSFVQYAWIEKIERKGLSEDQLLDLTPKELETMFRCDGEKVYLALHSLPRVEVEATIKPITYTIIQVDAWLYPSFKWNDQVYGKTGVQSFYLLLENINENLIVHHEKVLLNKKKVLSGEPIHIVFTIPVKDHDLTNVYQLRICSEYYLVDDTVVPLSMHNCILPKSIKSHTDLLDLDPLPISTLKNTLFQSIYNYSFFNPIQTQVFHCLYKTDESSLIGAPTGSGKTCCAELAIFRLLQNHPGKKCVYIAPLKALVRERVLDWKTKFEENMGYK